MGYSRATFEFLAGLAGNNTREWFEDNRATYETEVKERSLDLIADLSRDMSGLSPALRAEPKLNGSFRRINRDTRFSKDKTPYNPRVHLVFWHGEHPNRSPAMHFVFHHDGIGYGAGQWAIETQRLKTLRDRILDETEGHALEVALKEASVASCQMGEPDLKRVPRGFDANAPRSDLLRYKGFVARTHETKAPIENGIGGKTKGWMMTRTEALMPLIRWLSS